MAGLFHFSSSPGSASRVCPPFVSSYGPCCPVVRPPVVFIHLSVDAHLGCFHFLAVESEAAGNPHLSFVWTSFLLRSYRRLSASHTLSPAGRPASPPPPLCPGAGRPLPERKLGGHVGVRDPLLIPRPMLPFTLKHFLFAFMKETSSPHLDTSG